METSGRGTERNAIISSRNASPATMANTIGVRARSVVPQS